MKSQRSRSAPCQMSWCLSILLFATTHLCVHSFAPACSTIIPSRHTAASAVSSSALDATAVIAGATGYIGKSVVREAIRQGFDTVALVRDVAKAQSDPNLADFLKGATLVACDVTHAEALEETLQTITKDKQSIDVMVSCLASRSGVKKDAYLIDYQATLNFLEAGRKCQAKYFVLLSAFCVKNPTLQFQQAKLKFEAALTAQTDIPYTIVRPTAFFKSVSGQLEVVQSGAPFVMFGDGQVTRCNPIAESELAEYLLESATQPERRNQIINLGGPDDPITMRQQGDMLFAATGKEPKFIQAPLVIFDVVINALQWLADLSGSEKLADAAETGRIGKYYAVEDMLTTEPNEKYGKVTLRDHYNRIAVEGQEYDPYTTMFSRATGVNAKEMREEKLKDKKVEA